MNRLTSFAAAFFLASRQQSTHLSTAFMVKKFTATCDFGGQTHPITLYIGKPKFDSHPLQFQSTWLSKNRGGSVPASIMDSFSKIAKIAEEKHVSFDELCAYVVDELKSTETLKQDVQEATKFSTKQLKSSAQQAKPSNG